jgi:release factor glutamine methyltransferase
LTPFFPRSPSGSLPTHELRRIRERARNQREYDELVARREAGEPLQYVVARWGFRTLDLYVDQRVLIPRPETEVVAGVVIDLDPQHVVVDLGTGSGAIALSVAVETNAARVIGTDASPDALSVARANLAGLGQRALHVELYEGDWFAAVPADVKGQVDVIVSNPPYIAANEELPSEVIDWEPRDALIAGATGLEAIERIVTEASEWLRPDGALVVEIAPHQRDAVLATCTGFADVEIRKDLTGRDRVLVAR